jgi:drug/metabolite transporter (DMT)-like permease
VRQSKHPVAAVTALAMCTLGWTFAPVFIRLLKDDYEPLTQGFVRYAFGSAFLIALCLIYHRQALFTLLRNPWPVIGISALNVFQQYVWTTGTYATGATMAQLVIKLSVVFVVIFAFILFHEERAVIRNPLYLFGTALSIAGVCAVLVRDPNDLAQLYGPGSLFLLTAAVCWGVYAVWGKHIVLGIHPIPMFAVVSMFSTIGLGATSLLFEDTSAAWRAGAWTTFVAAISGILAIGGAHACFHYAQRHFGSAFTNSFMLILPLTTYGAARIILPNEALTLMQWMGAGVLLSGTLIIILVENRRRAPVESLALAAESAASPVAERAL